MKKLLIVDFQSNGCWHLVDPSSPRVPYADDYNPITDDGLVYENVLEHEMPSVALLENDLQLDEEAAEAYMIKSINTYEDTLLDALVDDEQAIALYQNAVAQAQANNQVIPPEPNNLRVRTSVRRAQYAAAAAAGNPLPGAAPGFLRNAAETARIRAEKLAEVTQTRNKSLEEIAQRRRQLHDKLAMKNNMYEQAKKDFEDKRSKCMKVFAERFGQSQFNDMSPYLKEYRFRQAWTILTLKYDINPNDSNQISAVKKAISLYKHLPQNSAERSIDELENLFEQLGDYPMSVRRTDLLNAFKQQERFSFVCLYADSSKQSYDDIKAALVANDTQRHLDLETDKLIYKVNSGSNKSMLNTNEIHSMNNVKIEKSGTSKPNKTNGKRKFSTFNCSFCDKSGHTEDNCWTKNPCTICGRPHKDKSCIRRINNSNETNNESNYDVHKAAIDNKNKTKPQFKK
jgi:hypothetical protein